MILFYSTKFSLNSACSDEGLTLETSAKHHVPQATNTPYQSLLIKPILFTYKSIVNIIYPLIAELTSNLDWNFHINTITTKANKALGLLRRHLRCCSPVTKETAYKALVRPQIEYFSEVWNPCEKGNTETLEKVQRRAARFVKGDYHQQSSVTQMIKNLGWQSLKERRAVNRLTLIVQNRAWSV